MSSQAKGPTPPKVILHPDYSTAKVEQSDQQHMLSFFRVWLLDDMGKHVVQNLLQEKLGFDTATAQKTIAYMEQAITAVNKRTKELYDQQLRLFVSQYNEGKAANEQMADFKPEYFDKATLMQADAAIQAKLAEATDEYVGKLGNAIGKQEAANVRNLINEIRAYSHNMPPEDIEQIKKEAQEPLNYIINNKTLPQAKSGDVFGIIKKEL